VGKGAFPDQKLRAALAAARLILAQYGGNVLELTGWGNPPSEIGDVDTVWLDESSATTARRMSQTFQVSDGVLRGCRAMLLQADGSYLWEEFAVIRKSGTFKAPPGVRTLRIVLGQGGAVWYGVIDCNEEQEFVVHLGAGGAPAAIPGIAGDMGGHTTFGVYSSENGRVYANGYTDISNGQSFARTGVAAPLPGSGDGGKGSEPGEGYLYQNEGDIGYRFELVKPGGPGHPGVAGATGFAMVTLGKTGNGVKKPPRSGAASKRLLETELLFQRRLQYSGYVDSSLVGGGVQIGWKGYVAADRFLLNGAAVFSQISVHEGHDFIFLMGDFHGRLRERVAVILHINANQADGVTGHVDGVCQVLSACVNLQVRDVGHIAAFFQRGKYYRIHNFHNKTSYGLAGAYFSPHRLMIACASGSGISLWRSIVSRAFPFA